MAPKLPGIGWLLAIDRARFAGWQLRQTRNPAPGSDRGAHLGHQAVEHRIGLPAPDRIDRWLPQLPPVDQATAEQGSDHLEVDPAMFLERTELLAGVGLP